MFRSVLLVLGLTTLVLLVWHIGPDRIVTAISGLGPGAVGVMLVPSILMYAVEASGWRVTLGRQAGTVSFLRIFAIRTAGEVVNMTTPTAYVGGEPLKAYLLRREGIPLVTGMASVVTAKTTMTLAQIAFILLGIGIAFRMIEKPEDPGSDLSLATVVLGVGLLVLAAVVLLFLQTRGLFTGCLSLLRRLRLRVAYLEAREGKLQELDRAVRTFYANDRRGFFLSTGLFFLGWLAEALEVYAIIACMGLPITYAGAVAIGALSVFIKGGTFFVPGSLGAQEGGNLLLLVGFGYSEVDGLLFALCRRLREIVWIGIGLICLALMRGSKGQPQDSAM